MPVSMFRRLALAASLLCVPLATPSLAEPNPPPGLLLTWQHDPTTTMTIDWHRAATETDTPATLEFRKQGDTTWQPRQATRLDFPFTDRKIDRTELTQLEPDTAYEFRGSPSAPTYHFRTMPASLAKPLVFAVGGDTRHRKSWLEEMNRAAMTHNPAFIVWGGDLAYANGDPKNVKLWLEWFDANMKTLITPDRRAVPIVVGIGNHEVQGGSHGNRMNTPEDKAKYAPFFYRLFAFPGPQGYGVLDFGQYLSLVIGDTGHSNPIPGQQTAWLAETLAQRAKIPNVFPVYHVPAYPSNRDFNEKTSELVRTLWCPLFEQHGIQVAFENHDHTYKRTKPIRAGKTSPDGITYIGDGSWGVDPRPVHNPATTWYLEKAQTVRHGLIVTLNPTGKTITAINPQGQVIDEISLPNRQ